MKPITEKIQDCIYENHNKYNQTAGIRGMDLIPVQCYNVPSIIIGGPVYYNEEKIIKQMTIAASAIGLSAPLLSDYLKENELIPEDNERYILVYSLVDNRYSKIFWAPLSENPVDYDF